MATVGATAASARRPRGETFVVDVRIARMVREFHQRFGHPIATAPLGDPGERERSLRAALIEEEIGELRAAGTDRVAVADALGDIAVVVHAAALVYGADLPRLVANRALSGATPDIDDAGARVRTVIAGARGHDAVAGALADVMLAVHLRAEEAAIPLLDVVEEIHRSNMSKALPDGSVLYRESDNKILKGPDYSPPDLAPLLARADARTAS